MKNIKDFDLKDLEVEFEKLEKRNIGQGKYFIGFT